MDIAFCLNDKNVSNQMHDILVRINCVNNVEEYDNPAILTKDIKCGAEFDVVMLELVCGRSNKEFIYAEKISELLKNVKIVFMTKDIECFAEKIFLSYRYTPGGSSYTTLLRNGGKVGAKV